MLVILALFVVAMCGYRAYSLYRADPIDIVAWAWTAGWTVATVAAALLLFAAF